MNTTTPNDTTTCRTTDEPDAGRGRLDARHRWNRTVRRLARTVRDAALVGAASTAGGAAVNSLIWWIQNR